MLAKRVAVIILYDSDSKILLQHRTKDAPTLPDHWSFFGGGIESGETASEAIKRECLEELGYELQDPHLFKTLSISIDGAAYRTSVFIERYSGAPLILGEGQGMGWFLPDATEGLLMNEHDRAIIKSLKSAIR